jgi:hypothetical protein
MDYRCCCNCLRGDLGYILDSLSVLVLWRFMMSSLHTQVVEDKVLGRVGWGAGVGRGNFPLDVRYCI